MEKRKLEIQKEFSMNSLKDTYYVYVDGRVVAASFTLDEAMEDLKKIKASLSQARPAEVVYEEVF